MNIKYSIVIIALIIGGLLLISPMISLEWYDDRDCGCLGTDTCMSVTKYSDGDQDYVAFKIVVPEDAVKIKSLYLGIKDSDRISGYSTSAIVYSGLSKTLTTDMTQWEYSLKHWLVMEDDGTKNPSKYLNPFISATASDSIAKDPYPVTPGATYFFIVTPDSVQETNLFVTENTDCYGELWLNYRGYGWNKKSFDPNIAIWFEYDVVEPPVIKSINGDTTGGIGQELSYSITYSGSASSFNFNWGDGTETGWQTASYSKHAYSSSGTKTITAYAKGLDGDSVSKTLNVVISKEDLPKPYIDVQEVSTVGKSVEVKFSSFTYASSTDMKVQCYIQKPGGDYIKNKWTDVSISQTETGRYDGVVTFTPEIEGVYSIGARTYAQNTIKYDTSEIETGSTEAFDTGGADYHTVTFHVTDSELEPLSAIEIVIGAINVESIFTDSNGVSVIDLKEGTHTFSITDSKYKSLTGSAIVNEDTDIYVKLVKVGEEGESEFNDTGFGGNIYLLIILIIVGIVLSLIAIWKLPIYLKILVPVIYWVLLLILWFFGIV